VKNNRKINIVVEDGIDFGYALEKASQVVKKSEGSSILESRIIGVDVHVYTDSYGDIKTSGKVTRIETVEV